MKTCIHCGTENGDGVKFCEHCGEPMEIVITAYNCPGCKREIADPRYYCPHCGTELKCVIPAYLRGTWVCRGADSGKRDITRILTVNQMQTNFSDGRVWIGIAKKIGFSFWAGDCQVTFSVTAARGYDDMKVGDEVVQSFPLNDEKNKFSQVNANFKNIYIKQEADIVIPAELRGTWLRRGVDSGWSFDLTRIVTVNQMQTNHSDGSVWIGVVKSVRTAKNPSPFKAGEYPSGWIITFSVTAVEGWDDIKVGQEYVRGFYLNATKNAFTQDNNDFKDIFVKQEQ